jgi:hypothetical protein
MIGKLREMHAVRCDKILISSDEKVILTVIAAIWLTTGL